MFFLNRFPACFDLFVLLFLVTSCLVVAVQPCMESIPIKKKSFLKITFSAKCFADIYIFPIKQMFNVSFLDFISANIARNKWWVEMQNQGGIGRTTRTWNYTLDYLWCQISVDVSKKFEIFYSLFRKFSHFRKVGLLCFRNMPYSQPSYRNKVVKHFWEWSFAESGKNTIKITEIIKIWLS